MSYFSDSDDDWPSRLACRADSDDSDDGADSDCADSDNGDVCGSDDEEWPPGCRDGSGDNADNADNADSDSESSDGMGACDSSDDGDANDNDVCDSSDDDDWPFERRDDSGDGDDSADDAIPQSPDAKRQKTRPPRVQFYARKGVPELGTVVSGPKGYGEWRSVPGFSADKLRVSECGFYQVSSKGKWQNPSAGSEKRAKDGTARHIARVDEHPYLVYHFVLRAFKGPRPRGTTADHVYRNTSDNSAINLMWATRSEQNGNKRTDKKAYSHGKPVRIRHKDWPVERDWESFENGLRAAKHYGLHQGSVSAVAKGERTHTGGFSVEFLPAPESQEPLGIGDDSNLEAPPLDPPPSDRLGAGPSTTIEEWRLAPGVTNLRVSTRGRVQRKDVRGGGWGYMHTPVANAGNVYAIVTYKGENVVVHRLVWMTFMGPIPKGMTIDHMIPSHKFDNRLSALRLATQREQNGNQDHKPISERSNSMKTAVRGRPANGSDGKWETFESQIDAQRVLHARFPDKKFDSSAIGGSARAASEGKKRSVRYGWVFEYV